MSKKRAKLAKNFLEDNFNQDLYLSDFSLHSLGVILVKRKMKMDIYKNFISTDFLKFTIASTAFQDSLLKITDLVSNLKLDYDDAYQFITAKNLDLTLVTLDKDFEKVKDQIEVKYL